MANFSIDFYWLWYTFLMILKSYSDLDFYKIVVTENGAVRGRLDTTYLQQKPYYAFRGVPYAKPPIGVLRFKVC